MALDAAAADGVVAVSALQGRCQPPQLGHNLQQMCVERQGDDAIICRALSTNAQRTAYGRRLKSVQGKEQPVALAVAQTPGSAGYASAVLAQIASFQPGSKRLEAMVESRVCLFDGWLALTTDGTVRFWTRDDVRAFFACGDQAK